MNVWIPNLNRTIDEIDPITPQLLEHTKGCYCFQGQTTSFDSIYLYAAPALVNIDSPRRIEATHALILALMQDGFLEGIHAEGGWFVYQIKGPKPGAFVAKPVDTSVTPH